MPFLWPGPQHFVENLQTLQREYQNFDHKHRVEPGRVQWLDAEQRSSSNKEHETSFPVHVYKNSTLEPVKSTIWSDGLFVAATK